MNRRRGQMEPGCHLQYAVFDSGANPLGLAVTDAATLVLGG